MNQTRETVPVAVEKKGIIRSTNPETLERRKLNLMPTKEFRELCKEKEQGQE